MAEVRKTECACRRQDQTRRWCRAVSTTSDLSRAIAARLRAGASYRHCDTDGYHDEIAYRDGHFTHVDGFRATSNAPTRLADEAAAVALVCAIHPRPASASEVEVLEAVLATLSAGEV